MGQWFSRGVGSESFFTGLDGKLDNLQQRLDRLEAKKTHQKQVFYRIKARFLAIFASIYVCVLAYAAWVVQQPKGTFTNSQHISRISPVFVCPALGYLMYQGIDALSSFFIRRTDAAIANCRKKSDKIIHGLKDTMRFERTHELLCKYDPEYRNAFSGKKELASLYAGRDGLGSGGNKKEPSSLSRKASAVAASTVGGAGMRLSSALAQLWGAAADTLLADDPVLMNSLKLAESQGKVLEAENAELKKKLERYEDQFGILYDVEPCTLETESSIEEKESEEEDQKDDDAKEE